MLSGRCIDGTWSLLHLVVNRFIANVINEAISKTKIVNAFSADRSGQLLYFLNSLPQIAPWTPAVDDSGVYFYRGGTDGYLKIFDPVTGSQIQGVCFYNREMNYLAI